MKRSTTQRNEVLAENRAATFEAVFDSRKRKIPGLWKRGVKFYAQLRVDMGSAVSKRSASYTR